MKEYIEREAAINTINKLRICLREQGAYDYDLGAEEAKLRVESIPAADVVEVRHGRWEHGREACREYRGDCLVGVLYDRWTCSECGYVVDDHKYFAINYNFCPHCGAKMTREYVAYYDGVYETRSRK